MFPYPEEVPLISYYNAVATVVWPTLMTTTKRDWQGQENLGSPGDGMIYAANHLSYLDPMLMLHFSNDADRVGRFLTKDSLIEIPVIGSIIEGGGSIPVYRNTENASLAVSEAVKAVKHGGAVWIYPEGTLTRDPDLWPMTAKNGVARIAFQSGKPVIPVAHWGVQEIQGPYEKKLNLFPRKTIQVVAGPPVDLDDLRELHMTEEVLNLATLRIMDVITGMLATLRGEVPPRDPWNNKTKSRPKLSRTLQKSHTGIKPPVKAATKKAATKKASPKKTAAKKASAKTTAKKK